MRETRLQTILRLTCAAVVVALAYWTVAANAVSLTGHSFADLRRLVPLVVVAAVVTLVALFPPQRAGTVDLSDNGPETAEASSERWVLIRLAVGAGLAATFALAHQYTLFWGLTVVYLGYSYLRERPSPMLRFRPVGIGNGNVQAFAAAAILAVLAALLLNRPNVDQTLSINMAVSVLDNPASAIFRADSLHGIAGAYFIPSYRVHSFELLAAWLADSLRIAEPIVVFQFILAPILSLFSVLAAAMFFRTFLPRWWGWAALILAAVLLIVRQTYTMYGNLGYVRMFEGKSVFVTALIPLIAVYGVDFFIRPTMRKWFLLFLAQAAAVGLTANALYAAPLAAGLALVAAWRPTTTATWRVALGVTASLYPVVVGLLVRSAFYREGLAVGLEEFQGLVPMDEAVRLVMGSGFTLWLWLVALTSAWSAVRDRATRVWILAFTLGFMLLCMNPFLETLWGLNVTANYLTWRLLWVIPLPAFLAIFLTEILAGRPAAEGRRGLAWLVAIAAVAIVLAADRPWEDSGLTTFGPGLKVPRAEYIIAERLNRAAGPGESVLAPETVAAWVPTFRQHALPVVARRHYTEGILAIFPGRVDGQDLKERLQLLDLVSGVPGAIGNLPVLERWLNENRLDVVAVAQPNPAISQITTALHHAGFSESEEAGYLIFLPSE